MSSGLSKSDANRYKEYLRSEIEAASMYKILAQFETDPEKSEIFEQLSQSEVRHARHWSEKLGNPIADVTLHTLQNLFISEWFAIYSVHKRYCPGWQELSPKRLEHTYTK